MEGLRPAGQHRWDVGMGQDADASCSEVMADPTGGVVVGGEGWGNVSIAGNNHQNGGSVDGILASLD